MKLYSNVNGSIISISEGVKILCNEGYVHFYKNLKPFTSIKLGSYIKMGDFVGTFEDNYLHYEAYKYEDVRSSATDIKLAMTNVDVVKMLNSTSETARAIGGALSGMWKECANTNKEDQFYIHTIPLQILTKVSKETSSREIEHVVNTVKSIIPSGVTKYDKEGVELTRIERILENRIEENLKFSQYKSLEFNVRLLQKIKEGYKPFRPIGCKV